MTFWKDKCIGTETKPVTARGQQQGADYKWGRVLYRRWKNFVCDGEDKL